MHTAYKLHSLIKLPLDIECILACNDHLFVGAKQGHLLLYDIKQPASSSTNTPPPNTNSNSDENSGYDLNVRNAASSPSTRVELEPKVQLLRTDKTFSKKPIVQMAAIPEHSVLVVLTNGNISAHDMDVAVCNFPVITVLDRARGASLFAVDCVRQRTLTGETAVVARMAVAVKRKIQFYYWKNRKFLELYADVSVPDVPKSLVWYKDSLCVGLRNQYMLVKMAQNQELVDLFPTGQNGQAQITRLLDDRFALQKNNQTTFIDLQGNLKLYTVAWGGSPLAMCHDPPYLLAVQNNVIEVKTEDPKLNIQTLNFPGARFLSSHRQPHQQGLVYVASPHEIGVLKMEPVSVQIPQLLRDKQFELAVILSTLSDDDKEDKEERIRQIKTLSAFDLFCQQKFKESLNVFFQLNIDPSHVIGLYSEMLPQEFRNQIKYPDRLPVLQGREMEKSVEALVEYLTQVRHRIKAEEARVKELRLKETKATAMVSVPMVKGNKCITSRKQMLQISDTTLLKCYLRTNDALVAPLLRLKDNECHQEEAERALLRGGKFMELVTFYNTRGNREKELGKEEEMEEVKLRAAGAHDKASKCRRRALDAFGRGVQLHQKALTLLKEHHLRSDSSIRHHMHTVQYLQGLGPENKELIFRNAGWLFEVDELDALLAFTDDRPEVETLPRKEVLEFLSKTKPSTVIPYLEHIIAEWGEHGPFFHNRLILQYKEAIMEKKSKDMTDSASSLFQEENDEVKELRVHLKKHLLTSQNFSPDYVLSQFPYDCLEEERAILLGSLQQHTEALTLYLYKMRDYPRALDYCQKHYRPNSDIFSLLLVLMLEPPEPSLLRQLSISTDAKPPTSLDDALTLLSRHGHKVDERQTMRLLPTRLPLQKVFGFVRGKLQTKTRDRHNQQMKKSLLQAEHLQVKAESMRVQSIHVLIKDTDVCAVCKKRFGNQGAFVRLPEGGKVVHYACREKARM